MARFCVSDGITHIIATPHCHRYIHLLRADILPRVKEVNSQLFSANIPLTILPGSEIQVTDTLAYRREFESGVYCHLGDGRSFTLLEFNWSRDLFPKDAAELVQWIRSQGMIPILAHPERHPYFSLEPALLQALVDAGAWIQITVDSLLGNHGPAPQTAGEHLLGIYYDAVLATDAHNMVRCSGLSAGYSWVKSHLGNERCNNLINRIQKVLNSCIAENL